MRRGEPATRETELRTAMLDADLPPRDFKVFMWLLHKRATWVTAEIRPEFQLRNLDELARRCHMPLATVKRALNHLERHGWLIRERQIIGKGIGGRGHSTHYQLGHGTNCDCPKGAQTEPVYEDKGAQNDTVKGLTYEDVFAGQTPVPAKSVNKRGEAEEGPVLCRVCQLVMDPVLPANGYTTHPCCNPDEISPKWPRPNTGHVRLLRLADPA